MITGIETTGLEEVLGKLNEHLKQIPFKSLQGLIKAGFRMKRESQKNVPVDTANLKASSFIVWSGGGGSGVGVPAFTSKGKDGSSSLSGSDLLELGSSHVSVVQEAQSSIPMAEFNPTVIVGFTAFYAMFVEEDEEADHSQSGGGGAHYFRNAIDANMMLIVSDVREATEVK
jgi:hypothetical protein